MPRQGAARLRRPSHPAITLWTHGFQAAASAHQWEPRSVIQCSSHCRRNPCLNQNHGGKALGRRRHATQLPPGRRPAFGRSDAGGCPCASGDQPPYRRWQCLTDAPVRLAFRPGTRGGLVLLSMPGVRPPHASRSIWTSDAFAQAGASQSGEERWSPHRLQHIALASATPQPKKLMAIIGNCVR